MLSVFLTSKKVNNQILNQNGLGIRETEKFLADLNAIKKSFQANNLEQGRDLVVSSVAEEIFKIFSAMTNHRPRERGHRFRRNFDWAGSDKLVVRKHQANAQRSTLNIQHPTLNGAEQGLSWKRRTAEMRVI